MRELDVMLGRWLEQQWPASSKSRQRDFERLLACEDDQIWDWLMGRVDPEPELAGLVAEIREYNIGRRQD
jgi:antitoxin CptB